MTNKDFQFKEGTVKEIIPKDAIPADMVPVLVGLTIDIEEVERGSQLDCLLLADKVDEIVDKLKVIANDEDFRPVIKQVMDTYDEVTRKMEDEIKNFVEKGEPLEIQLQSALSTVKVLPPLLEGSAALGLHRAFREIGYLQKEG
jgi:hypothetical protein